MVSFSCENCGDVLTKKKLDGHRNQCYGASYTCLDCMVHFPGTSYKSHTACITEDQKYQGKLYKEKKPKGGQQHQQQQRNNQHQHSQALTPHNAYVQDASNAVAVVDAPPRAPTPPPAAHSLGYNERAALPPVNVFDFLDASATPRPAVKSRMIEDSQPPAYDEGAKHTAPDAMKFQVADDQDSAQNGFAHGEEAIRPSNERYDSYVTPAPKSKHSKTKSKDVETTSKKSDRKRKRNSPSELDMALVHAQQERDVMMADTPAVLHSGLTGGLSKLLARPEFPPSPEDSGDYANSPMSPTKRAKQGTSKALMRAQKEWEAQQQKERKAETKEDKTREKKEKKEKKEKEKKEKERGRERDRKEHKASSALVKIRPKKKREDSSKEIRRIRRREYSSSVSPSRQDDGSLKTIKHSRSDSNSPAPGTNGQLIVRPNGDLATHMDPRAELFMSFVTKGPESERGISINKALKRYHRERRDSEPSKLDEEKELWKSIRLRKNDRGEVVLFFAPPETS